MPIVFVCFSCLPFTIVVRLIHIPTVLEKKAFRTHSNWTICTIQRYVRNKQLCLCCLSLRMVDISYFEHNYSTMSYCLCSGPGNAHNYSTMSYCHIACAPGQTMPTNIVQCHIACAPGQTMPT